jgi:nucleotide-binding universal stress UspA family protein
MELNESGGGNLRVLWATDGSQNSRAAIPLLRSIILPATERITVLTVAPHSLLSGARPDPTFLTKIMPRAKKRALFEAEETARQEATLLDPLCPVEAISRWGNPIETILKVARSSRVNMIVMAAKGHSNLGMLVLGSVTQGVVQHATLPVLIARPGAESVGRILLGYDGTPPARRAVQFLDRLALPQDVDIIFTHVIEPFGVPAGTPVSYRARAIEEAHKINERRHRQAERALALLKDRFSATGRTVITEAPTGKPDAVLDESARKHHASLVVVGSRKPSPAQHYLLGSTAEKLVRHSHTSMLVVR